jgi:exopolysaccharide production protein ExoZ
MSSQSTSSANAVSKYQGLQILRITAAFMVLLTHSTFYASERLDKHFAVWGRGATGVGIFFVLSGFVMVYSSQKLVNNPIGWKIFAERRIVRIVPMYWMATSVKILAVVLTTGYVLHAQFSTVNTIASYLFLPAYSTEGDIGPILGVGWTLNFEMFFYFLFALALFLRVNVYRFVGGVLTLLAFGAFFRKPNWPAVSFYLNTGVLQFFYGMVIAKACLAGKHIPKRFAMLLLGLGFLGLLGPWPALLQLHGLEYGIAAALIVYSTASLEDALTQIPRIVLLMADASYVIYLFHPFIAPAVPAALARLHLLYPSLSVVCSVILALGGGCLIHLLVDAPITRWFRNHLLIRGKKVIHTTASV